MIVLKDINCDCDNCPDKNKCSMSGLIFSVKSISVNELIDKIDKDNKATFACFGEETIMLVNNVLKGIVTLYENEPILITSINTDGFVTRHLSENECISLLLFMTGNQV